CPFSGAQPGCPSACSSSPPRAARISSSKSPRSSRRLPRGPGGGRPCTPEGSRACAAPRAAARTGRMPPSATAAGGGSAPPRRPPKRAPTRPRSSLEGERKQVTVLFADVEGSMAIAEQVDPEQWHRILDRFFQILADGVHRFEGTINQFTGDGIMALFGAPIAHE